MKYTIEIDIDNIQTSESYFSFDVRGWFLNIQKSNQANQFRFTILEPHGQTTDRDRMHFKRSIESTEALRLALIKLTDLLKYAQE